MVVVVVVAVVVVVDVVGAAVFSRAHAEASSVLASTTIAVLGITILRLLLNFGAVRSTMLTGIRPLHWSMRSPSR
ncbi:hypothetical protein C1S82_21870 [Mycolicibacterium cosmeticum]|nr:hypothetical protein C1S82_21870 [Mycolicibacterium cosmeticum]